MCNFFLDVLQFLFMLVRFVGGTIVIKVFLLVYVEFLVFIIIFLGSDLLVH